MKKPIHNVTIYDVCTPSELLELTQAWPTFDSQTPIYSLRVNELIRLSEHNIFTSHQGESELLTLLLVRDAVRELIALSESDIFTGYQGEAELLTLLLVRAAKVSKGIEI